MTINFYLHDFLKKKSLITKRRNWMYINVSKCFVYNLCCILRCWIYISSWKSFYFGSSNDKEKYTKINAKAYVFCLKSVSFSLRSTLFVVVCRLKIVFWSLSHVQCWFLYVIWIMSVVICCLNNIGCKLSSEQSKL